VPLEPPTPILPSNLPTLLSGLTWVAVTGKANAAGSQLGHWVNNSNPLAPVKNFTLAGQSSGASTAWGVQTSLGAGTGELLFTSGDGGVMQNGTVNTDGSVSYGGHTYVAQVFNDSTAGFICQLKQTA
jgi:hypothetical protein